MVRDWAIMVVVSLAMWAGIVFGANLIIRWVF